MNNISDVSAFTLLMKRKNILLLMSCMAFSSCKDEPIPSYIHIPSYTLTTTASEGSSSNIITDAWVYQEGNLQGVYELPAQFPIIADGQTRLVVFAGIKLNGISATRAAYPFYSPDTIDIPLTPKVTDTLYPSVKYSPLSVFSFIEDFESGSIFGKIIRSAADVFEGDASGKMEITDSSEVFILSTSSYVIPFFTQAAFLEMNYKNNHVFDVGIRARYGGEVFDFYKLTIAPRNEWNKIYINFTPEIGQLQADAYHIYFRAVPRLPPDEIKIFLDNLKLIHARIP